MTAILTQRCDPFGVERERYGEKLAGGLYPEATVGRYVWHCEETVIGRYKFVCKGGNYGFRRQNDGGLIKAFHCDGGHTGLPMNLCKIHVSEMSSGPPKPGWSADRKNSYGQIGGTVSNEMCPRCIAPTEAREPMERANFLQAQLSAMMTSPIAMVLGARRVAIESELDQVRARLDELNELGIIHKCPLILREVS